MSMEQSIKSAAATGVCVCVCVCVCVHACSWACKNVYGRASFRPCAVHKQHEPGSSLTYKLSSSAVWLQLQPTSRAKSDPGSWMDGALIGALLLL